jgi:hypothetical protein
VNLLLENNASLELLFEMNNIYCGIKERQHEIVVEQAKTDSIISFEW